MKRGRPKLFGGRPKRFLHYALPQKVREELACRAYRDEVSPPHLIREALKTYHQSEPILMSSDLGALEEGAKVYVTEELYFSVAARAKALGCSMNFLVRVSVGRMLATREDEDARVQQSYRAECAERV